MREWMARWNRIRSAVRPSSNELETIDEKEPSRQKHAADPLPGVGLTRPPTDGLVDRMSAAEGAAELQSCRGGTPPHSVARTNKRSDQNRYRDTQQISIRTLQKQVIWLSSVTTCSKPRHNGERYRYERHSLPERRRGHSRQVQGGVLSVP